MPGAVGFKPPPGAETGWYRKHDKRNEAKAPCAHCVRAQGAEGYARKQSGAGRCLQVSSPLRAQKPDGTENMAKETK